MAARQWPLIAFTLLSQTAVGIFLLFVLPLALTRKQVEPSEARIFLIRALAGVLSLLAVAALISFFHLGNVLNAYRVLNNLRNSWLSREIFFEILMGFLLILLAGAELRRIGNTAAVTGLYLLAALTGAALIWSMANIYRVESIPVWDNAMTPFSFFMTVLVLGALTSAVLPAPASLSTTTRFFPFAGTANIPVLAFVGIQLAAAILFDPGFGLRKVPAACRRSGSGSKPSASMAALFTLRLSFLILAFVLILLDPPKSSSMTPNGPFSPLAAAALFSALISETLGRTLFYALFKKVGLS